MKPQRILWLCTGLVSVGLGVLGVFLPLLPTTPFILLAAFCFARSSQRCHDWLLDHRVFGPMIADWRAHGAIAPSAKRLGVISMVAVLGMSVVLNAPPVVLAIQAVVLAAAAVFVVTRPDPPGQT